MKKIDQRMREVLSQGEKILVSGVPVGYPSLDETRKLVEVYIRSGIDVVEFSMPIRNPYIDTKIIADSNISALDKEPNLEKHFEMLHKIREDYPDEPFYMMAYANTIKEFGLKRFVEQLVELEIDGVELPDKDEIVPELAEALEDRFYANDIYRIFFLQHPLDHNYLMEIKDKVAGFALLQSVANADGKRPTVADENEQLIETVKRETDVPLILGYGIRTPEHVKKAVDLGADGIIIGTAMVEYITQGDYDVFAKYIRGLKDATLP